MIKKTSNSQLWESLSHAPIKCNRCGCISDSIKCYRLPELFIFLVCWVYGSSANAIGCPKCIRKKIFLKGFTYNIITGNLAWLLIILPWVICQLIRSFTKGHSNKITEALFNNYVNEHNLQ